MSSPTPPLPGITYPNLHESVHPSVKAAVRNIYDNLFFLRNQSVSQGSASSSAGASTPASGIALLKAFPTPDGSLVNFQFTGVPSILFLNGVAQRLGTDYAQRPNTTFITFLTYHPISTDQIYAMVVG